MEVKGVRLRQARETVYLEVRLSENGGIESELECRTGMAATTAGTLREPVFGNEELSCTLTPVDAGYTQLQWALLHHPFWQVHLGRLQKGKVLQMVQPLLLIPN